jgi:hypothetical protein
MRIFLILLSLTKICLASNAQAVIFPKEFPKNIIGKKFCGTASTTGNMYGGSKAFLDIPFELFVSKDDGVYVRYNPREKFGEYDWGTTQKITSFKLYKTTSTTDNYGNVLGVTYYYQVPLSINKHAINEISVYDFYGTELAPPSKQLVVNINVPSYKNASINTNYRTVSVCGTIKTAEEIKKEAEAVEIMRIESEEKKVKQDNETIKSIETYIKSKDARLALQEFSKLNKSSSDVYDRIKSLIAINNLEIMRLLEEKKIDQALKMYEMTGPNENTLSKIKSVLSDIYYEPQTKLETSQLISLLSSNLTSELNELAFDPSRNLFLIIQKDGQAILKNGTIILKQFRAEDQFIAKNSYKEITFKVDASYALTLEVDSLKSSFFGIEFSKDFLQFKSDIDAKKLAYYAAEKEQLILTKVSDGNDNSKKYPEAKRINNFEFSNDYMGKKARFVYSCPLKLNGQPFSTVTYKDKNFITTFKKFK